MKTISIIGAAVVVAFSATLALAQFQEPGKMGGVQGGSDGTAQGTTGAPGANMIGGTGTAGTGPDDPASDTSLAAARREAAERRMVIAGIIPEDGALQPVE